MLSDLKKFRRTVKVGPLNEKEANHYFRDLTKAKNSIMLNKAMRSLKPVGENVKPFLSQILDEDGELLPEFEHLQIPLCTMATALAYSPLIVLCTDSSNPESPLIRERELRLKKLGLSVHIDSTPEMNFVDMGHYYL